MITDTHTHLYWKSYDEDRALVLERARASGVRRMIVVGTELETSRAALELCARHAQTPAGELQLHATAGVHPHDAPPAAVRAELHAAIAALCARPDCVAVGETGLDYYRNLAPREDQLENFAWHIALARQLDKPLVIHCRDAHADTAALLRSSGATRGVMHCYSMGAAELAPYIELGLYISFSGSLTYPPNHALREAARAVPADRLVVETDCPFLAPQPERGKRNEPAHVRHVLAELARVRERPLDELERLTSANAARLFALTPLA